MSECCQCGHKAEFGFVTVCDSCYDENDLEEEEIVFKLQDKIERDLRHCFLHLRIL